MPEPTTKQLEAASAEADQLLISITNVIDPSLCRKPGCSCTAEAEAIARRKALDIFNLILSAHERVKALEAASPAGSPTPGTQSDDLPT